MRAYIYDKSGTERELPTLLSWDISHGFCSPCDSFQVEFLYSQEMLEVLEGVLNFKAVHEGETVFCGLVDEFFVSADAGGSIAVLRGRGMQALMLDSEAEAADYFGADTDFILSRHVIPFGIRDVDKSGCSGRASFSVNSGESHWSVFQRFARFCMGMSPRFTPSGTLLIDGMSGGRRLRMDHQTPLSAQSYCRDWYGAVTEAVVKNRALGSSTKMENESLSDSGRKCVRVINVPRKTGYDAMRHTAAYQMEMSMENMRRCTVKLPVCFAAFPGDRISMESSPLGISGEFYVLESRCVADGKGAYTVLELRAV